MVNSADFAKCPTLAFLKALQPVFTWFQNQTKLYGKKKGSRCVCVGGGGILINGGYLLQAVTLLLLGSKFKNFE